MPAALRIALTAWMRSNTRPSRRRSSSSVDVERDADAVVLGGRPARQFVPLALDDVGGLEQLAGDAEAAVVEWLDLAALERGADVAQARTQARAEHAQVRQHARGGHGAGVEFDALHAQLFGDLPAWAAAAGAPRT